MEFMDTDIGESISRDEIQPKVATIDTEENDTSHESRPHKKSKHSHSSSSGSKSKGRSLASKPPREKSPLFKSSTALHILQGKKSPSALELPHPAAAQIGGGHFSLLPSPALHHPPHHHSTTSHATITPLKHPKPFRAPPRNKLEQERMNLPIYAAKDDIISAVQQNDNVIIIGETGSGKTTQIPQFLLSSGLVGAGQVGCTQPRRVAAISVATRVAQEYGCTLGAQVGYSIRFEDVTSSATRIKYITDGMLLREIIADPLLQNYNAIILDEAHERTVNTDILFALLKQIQRKRKAILAARKERDRVTRANSPAAFKGKSPRLGSSSPALGKSPRSSPTVESPGLLPLNLDTDEHPPMTKTERRALRKKRKREEREKAEAAAAIAAGTNSTSSTLAAESTAVVPLTPNFSLDDETVPDLATIPNLAQMQDLKLVIMSATLSAKDFSEYFSDAPVLSISGRTFPVEIYHSEEAQVDYLDATICTTLQIHLDPESAFPGDILVFLTGSEEIELARKTLEEKFRRLPEGVPNVHLCTLYANLPSEIQMAVFEPTPTGARKIILSTNLAETSLTIPGIKYVVDSGVTKMRLFNVKTGGEVLKVVDISQAEAKQRSGRAGRDSAGFAYRLYTEAAFNSMKKDLIPEILRSNLASVVLQLKSLHVKHILKFQFMTAPSRESLTKALEELYILKALNYNGDLNEIGKLMVYFPLQPNWAKMLIKACLEKEYDCGVEVGKILSVMSVEGIFFIPAKNSSNSEKQLHQHRKQFAHLEGDHFTYLDAFNAYLSHISSTSGDTRSKIEWCRSHSLNYKNLEKVKKIYDQLAGLAKRLNLPWNSINERESGSEYAPCTVVDPIKKCFLFGLFMNVARKQPQDSSYLTLADSQKVYLHPSSVMIGREMKARPELIVFNTLVHTSRAYMRECMALPDLKWLVELVPEAYGDAATGSIQEGAAPKIKGGKHATLLHERLASSNANQSKLSSTQQTQQLDLKGSHKKAKKEKSKAPPTTSQSNTASSHQPMIIDSEPPTKIWQERPPKQPKQSANSGSNKKNTRADQLMHFVNAL